MSELRVLSDAFIPELPNRYNGKVRENYDLPDGRRIITPVGETMEIACDLALLCHQSPRPGVAIDDRCVEAVTRRLRQPVFDPEQHDIRALAIRTEQAFRIEQLLEYLVEGRERNRRRHAEFAHPILQGLLHRFGNETRRDREPAFLFRTCCTHANDLTANRPPDGDCSVRLSRAMAARQRRREGARAGGPVRARTGRVSTAAAIISQRPARASGVNPVSSLRSDPAVISPPQPRFLAVCRPAHMPSRFTSSMIVKDTASITSASAVAPT